MKAIGRYFGLKPAPARVFTEWNQRDALHVRLEPQLHEIVIPAPDFTDGAMSPKQVMEYEIINRLRDVAQNAAHLVVHGAMEAYTGQKQDPEKTARLVEWAIMQKDIEIEAAANRIAELEKQLTEVTTERNALERVLRR